MVIESKRGESHREVMIGRVEIRVEECKGCGLCVSACPTHVLNLSERFNGRGYHPAQWTGSGCTGCGVCFYACPEPGAIRVERVPVEGKVEESWSSN